MKIMNGYNYDNLEDDNNDEGNFIMEVVAAAAIAAALTILHYAAPYYNKTPYHDSALSGAAWVTELLCRHPECICSELGLHKHVFRALIQSCQPHVIQTHCILY